MITAAGSVAPRFNADITELTGGRVEENIRRLGHFEHNFAGLWKGGEKQFFGSTLLDPGEGPGGLCDPATALPAARKFKAFGKAVEVANELGGFCFDQFRLVERSMHGKLMAVWEGLTLAEQQQLRFHSIMTVMRSEGSGEDSAHADSFDGTICYFALMSNKIGTIIYPGAQVAWRDHACTQATTPREQFLREMGNGAEQPRPGALRYNAGQLGPERVWKGGSCVVLPPSVCHQIAAHRATDSADDDATTDSAGGTLATATAARWFCRVTLELIPAGASAQKPHGSVNPFELHSAGGWSDGLRSKVCRLVGEHVWGAPPAMLHH
jgi:hypothetical protein